MKFSSMASDYERILGESHKYYIKVKCEILNKIISEYFHNKNIVCVDFGCGTGEAEEIISKTFITIGIDLSKNMIKEAKKKNIKNSLFICADVLKLPFKTNSIDIIFSFSLLHHIPKNKRNLATKEVAHTLKNGGIITIFEHNPINPITRYSVKICPLDKDVSLIYPKDLETLFNYNDITVRNKGYCIFFPKSLGFLRKLEGIMKKIPIGGQYYLIGQK